MEQYYSIKQQYGETLLLFQVGDFYELFFEDAKKAAAFLGITLTTRGTNNGEPIPLCGVPVHALEYYLVKLVKGGFSVALCDQLEEAKLGVVVRRGVTQVFTPGTLTDETLLDQKSSSYLFSFFPIKDTWGLLFGELITGHIFVTILPAKDSKQLEVELSRFFPDEVLLPATPDGRLYEPFFKQRGYHTTIRQADTANDLAANQWIIKQFTTSAVKQVLAYEAMKNSLYLLYSYLAQHQRSTLEQFNTLHVYRPDDYMLLDPATQKNLDLIVNNYDGSRTHSLLALMDRAVTPMGSRMIKKWITRPLVKEEQIALRLDAVGHIKDHVPILQSIESHLQKIGDIERSIGRIGLGRGTLQDYKSLLYAFDAIEQLQILLESMPIQLLKSIAAQIGSFRQLKQLLIAALNQDETLDYTIRRGFDYELDSMRDRVEKSNDALQELEQAEQKSTGIASLKIRYNGVYGYYIEVTKPNIHLVPDRFIRHQTLVGKERYTTAELRLLASEIITAQSTIVAFEKAVFERVKSEVGLYVSQLRATAQALSHLDALYAFAKVAWQQGYERPLFNTMRSIVIKQGRHPIVEATLQHRFIPNDVLINDTQSLWVITGPNMGGKSTFLRQIALISIMAQCGSFVPAAAANLPLFDRLFTRIGAGDNVAEGKSTFLVEMEETAYICKHATERSLVILDEVGRGTSTFDGLALAQAIIEYMYTTIKSRCLFATHYHQLTHLSQTHPGVVSYYAASTKQADRMVLLYKIIPGSADGSFGIEVAKLAQIPHEIIIRAEGLVKELTSKEQMYGTAMVASDRDNALLAAQDTIESLQKALNRLQHTYAPLEELDPSNISPKQALDLLWKIKEN
jgi:DNA mismatch repair protein MutS